MSCHLIDHVQVPNPIEWKPSPGPSPDNWKWIMAKVQYRIIGKYDEVKWYDSWITPGGKERGMSTPKTIDLGFCMGEIPLLLEKHEAKTAVTAIYSCDTEDASGCVCFYTLTVTQKYKQEKFCVTAETYKDAMSKAKNGPFYGKCPPPPIPPPTDPNITHENEDYDYQPMYLDPGFGFCEDPGPPEKDGDPEQTCDGCGCN